MKIIKRFFTIFIVLFVLAPSSFSQDQIVYLDLLTLFLPFYLKGSTIFISEIYLCKKTATINGGIIPKKSDADKCCGCGCWNKKELIEVGNVTA